MGGELFAERPKRAQARDERIGAGDGPERVLEHREPMRRGLRRHPHRLHFRHDHTEKAERIEAPERPRAARQREDREQLVANPLGGDPGQPGGGGPDGRHRSRGQPEPERALEPNATNRTERILGERARVVDPQTARAQIVEPSGRIDHAGASAAQKLAQGNGESIHGEVPRRQIVLERRRPPVGQVEADSAREDPRRPALRIERHEGAAHPMGHAAGDVERARGDGHVQVGESRPIRPVQPDIAHRAADQHRRPRSAGGRLHGAQQRSRRRRQVVESEDGGAHGEIDRIIGARSSSWESSERRVTGRRFDGSTIGERRRLRR